MGNFSSFILIIATVLHLTSCGFINGEMSLSSIEVKAPSKPISPPIDLIDTWGISGRINDVAIAEGYLIAGTHRGLVIYDISSPYKLKIVNIIRHSSPVVKLSKINSMMFVAHEDGTLELLDVSSGIAPALLGAVNLTAPTHVITNGKIAYVADGPSGIAVVNFSDVSNIQIVKNVDTDGNVNHMTLEDGYLYVADHDKGIKIFNITNSASNPVQVGSLNLGQYKNANSIAIAGSYAYVGVEWNGTDVIDISDKSNPVFLVNHYDNTWGYDSPSNLEIKDNLLFHTNFDKGFVVYDISSPPSLVYMGSSRTSNFNIGEMAIAFAMTSTHAFVASTDNGITTVDLSDPKNPYIPYVHTTIYEGKTTEFTDLEVVSDNLVLICDRVFGRIISIDITNPQKPKVLGGSSESDCYRIAYAQNMAYSISAHGKGFKVFDFTDPAKPNELSSIPNLSDHSLSVKIYSLTAHGNFVYFSTNQGFIIYDVSNPKEPKFAGKYDGIFRAAVVEGTNAFLVGDTASLTILNISDPAHIPTPHILNLPISSPTTYDITKDRDSLYLLHRPGWSKVNVSSPTNPIIEHTEVALSSDFIRVMGNSLYFCDYDGGVGEYSISDLSNIVPTNAYHSVCYGIEAHNGNLFVIDEQMGLRILNANSRYYFDVINSTTRHNNGGGLLVTPNYSFYNDDGYGVLLFDITQPKRPALASRLNGPSKGGFALHGSTLYWGNSYAIRMVNIADPKNPIPMKAIPSFTHDLLDLTNSETHLYSLENWPGQIGVYKFDSDAGAIPIKAIQNAEMDNLQSISVYGNLLLGNSWGVKFFSLSDPENPTYLGRYDSPHLARHTLVEGNLAFVASGSGGLTILDISNPSTPQLKGSFVTPGLALRLAKKDHYIFIADGSSGVQIVDVSDPTKPILKSNLPSKTVGGNAISLGIHGTYLHVDAGPNAYEVFDISDIDNIHQ